MRFDGIKNRFRNRRYCCLVDNVVGSFEKSREVFRFGNISINDLGAILEGFHVFALARREVIDHFDGFTPAKQFFNDMRSNEPPTSRYDIHGHRATSDEIRAP